jgi:predicted PhzF superfamily epimerase YddE/YHI9
VQLEYFHVNSFTQDIFSGNPAGVCFPECHLPSDIMQKIAFENNLSETAFVVPAGLYYEIRWFTPEVEVDLCGHATLAAGHVLFNHKGFCDSCINFHSNTEHLSMTKDEGMLFLDFPARPAVLCAPPEDLLQAMGQPPVEVLSSRDYMAVFNSEEIIRNLQPDMELLRKLDKPGLIVTARGNESDFVSRFFAPREGIPEDPVTGSAHCTLIPYWANKLARSRMTALQVSKRGGQLVCQDLGKRVKIGGHAVTYSKGYIDIQPIM